MSDCNSELFILCLFVYCLLLCFELDWRLTKVSIMMDKLCLDWDGFKENIETNFAKYRQNEDLTDVTLVCEDGTQLVGHRLVLAASSLFFQNILGMKKLNQSLLILMRGVKPEDMSCLLDFMYCGKVDVKQENLEGFLKLAKELEVRGLFDVEGEEGNNDPHRIFSKTMTKNEASDDSKTNVLSSKKCSSPNWMLSGDPEELEAAVKTMMVKSENKINNGKDRMIRAYTCKVCGKEGFGSNIKSHIESHHIEGVQISCNMCRKTFR